MYPEQACANTCGAQGSFLAVPLLFLSPLLQLKSPYTQCEHPSLHVQAVSHLPENIFFWLL